MELNINITTRNNSTVVVSDTSTYLEESFSGTVKSKFKYSDTVSIDVLLHKETIYKEPVYTKHTTLLPIYIPIEIDGWLNLTHIVLPNVEWFNRELSKSEGSALSLYDLVYFSDGTNIYKYINEEVSLVNITEVLIVNTVDTTVSRISKDFVSICLLRKCYINLCLQIFNSRGFSNCSDRSKIDSELIYKRDLVWMAMNVIKYLTECEQLAEVDRIVETIQGCNGVCTSNNLISNSNGCGCSQ